VIKQRILRVLPGDQQALDRPLDDASREPWQGRAQESGQQTARRQQLGERLPERGHEAQLRAVRHIHVDEPRAQLFGQAVAIAGGMRVDPLDRAETLALVPRNEPRIARVIPGGKDDAARGCEVLLPVTDSSEDAADATARAEDRLDLRVAADLTAEA